MQIKVKLFATLTQRVSAAVLARYPQGIRAGRPFEVELPEGSTLDDLIAALGLPPEETKIVYVKGRAQPFDYRLQAGDEVGIFPPVGGG